MEDLPSTIHHLLFTIYFFSFPVLGRVEAENLLTLAGARVDGAEVLAPLHLPDGGDLPVLLDGVVGDLLGRGLGLRRRRRGLLARRLRRGRDRVLVLCHYAFLSGLSAGIFVLRFVPKNCIKA